MGGSLLSVRVAKRAHPTTGVFNKMKIPRKKKIKTRNDVLTLDN